MNDLEYKRAIYATLSTDLTIGPKTVQKLLNRFNAIESVWEHSSDHRIVKLRSQTSPYDVYQSLVKHNIVVVCWEDDIYPAILREIADPPFVFYLKGQLDRDFWGLAVVGARKCTDYGRRVARELTQSLATVPIPIISGLAIGIDSIAHQACLDARGVTVAVLACGLDRIYPTVHTRLAHNILDRDGALISEYPPGVPALPHHFPIRNRIIAGLSKGVIIIEAALKSGSLLTARSAVEYNREVFVVPHSIYSVSGQGPLNLLKMGAKLVTGVDDILDELRIHQVRLSATPTARAPATGAAETVILKVLADGPRHVDQMVESIDWPIAKLSATITLMEMKGLIVNLGGNIYQLRG